MPLGAVTSSVPMEDFDYELPNSAIAQVPVEPRTAARLLDATDPSGTIHHRTVAELPELLRPGDLVVVNDTRVIPARLELTRRSGGQVEVLLVEVRDPGRECEVWEAMVRPLKRCPPGTELVVPGSGEIACTVGERTPDGSRAFVTFAAGTVPATLGRVALPPYVHVQLEDPERYQTVYARLPGSVAAPTAGLHLTSALLERCGEVGASVASVELVVGLDTFRPVTADRPEEHVIHSERYSVPEETLEACQVTRRKGGRVVAIGTTTVRALESAASCGTLSGRTDLFIYGDFDFRVIDMLMTNFHMPRSTLLLMVEAFCGPKWRDFYTIAQGAGYRFLSFGDAMLLAKRTK